LAKNIVLFSDGTGDSAARPFKTNVWRLYQAIDIEQSTGSIDPEQIVYYVNGVGTERLKPIAKIGSALGLGVWKNVQDLYIFVCRNYEIGDHIYGFGFSRGAFTIRLLMGLIGKCGLLKADSEAELVKCVKMAHEAYRRDFLIRASKRRHMIYHHILRPPKYFKCGAIDLGEAGCKQVFPDIRFVGVWDTVDAYGMPVDELKLAIDERVWPMSFADRDPSDRLLTIRHALALDEDRQSFRPVLWNEVVSGRHLSPERIQQVWFSGVHSNVGGGYPDDGLALTALDWMMGEAEKVGLRYNDLARETISAGVNPDGEQYDSRAGIGGYYRYGPRHVAALCHDTARGVDVPTVRVHPAALERISAWRRDYEPISLGGIFNVAGVSKAPDAAALENAWDLVWWRRIAYFAALAMTAFVGLFALRLVFAWPDYILMITETALGLAWSFVSAILGATATAGIDSLFGWLLGHAGSVLPGWASATIPSFREYPLSGLVSLALLALAFFGWSRKLERRIRVMAEWAWASQKGLTTAAKPKTDWRNIVARALRPVTALLYRHIWRGVFVPVLGIAIGVVALIALSPILLWRALRRRPWMASKPMKDD